MDLYSSPLTTAAIAAAASLVAAFMTHLFGRSKNRADIHATIATGAGLAVDTMSDVLEQVRQELEETRRELMAARAEIEELRKDNAQLRQSVAVLGVKVSEVHKATGKKTDTEPVHADTQVEQLNT